MYIGGCARVVVITVALQQKYLVDHTIALEFHDHRWASAYFIGLRKEVGEAVLASTASNRNRGKTPIADLDDTNSTREDDFWRDSTQGVSGEYSMGSNAKDLKPSSPYVHYIIFISLKVCRVHMYL